MSSSSIVNTEENNNYAYHTPEKYQTNSDTSFSHEHDAQDDDDNSNITPPVKNDYTRKDMIDKENPMKSQEESEKGSSTPEDNKQNDNGRFNAMDTTMTNQQKNSQTSEAQIMNKTTPVNMSQGHKQTTPPRTGGTRNNNKLSPSDSGMTNNKNGIHYDNQYPPISNAALKSNKPPVKAKEQNPQHDEEVILSTNKDSSTPFKDALLQNDRTSTPNKNDEGKATKPPTTPVKSPSLSLNPTQPTIPTSTEVEKNTTSDDDPSAKKKSQNESQSSNKISKNNVNKQITKDAKSNIRKSSRLKNKHAASGGNTGKQK